MTQLENKSEVADLNNQVENDLNVIDPNASLNATEALLFREDNEKKLDSMKVSRDTVSNILDKVQELKNLESQLRESSEYRSTLNANVSTLSGYLQEMGGIINTFETNLAAGVRTDKKVVDANVKRFEDYANKAKEVESTLKNMEREIKNLKRDQDTNDRLDNMDNERQSQNESQQAEIDRLNQELAKANARAEKAEEQAKKQKAQLYNREKEYRQRQERENIDGLISQSQ